MPVMLPRATVLALCSLSACLFVGPPDGLECSVYDNIPCPAGQICEGVTCVTICLDTEDCGPLEVCVAQHCRAYEQGCMQHADCVEGWACDGVMCEKLNGTCSPDYQDICSSNAQCAPMGEQHFCVCDAGYAGDGRTCVDIDECASAQSPCPELAACLNTPGSYECHCPLGYQMDASNGCVDDWLDLSTGRRHTCGVRSDGTVWCFGDNALGQMNTSDHVAASEPMLLQLSGRFVGISSGAGHACALQHNGAVWCFGNNSHGQLGNNEAGAQSTAVLVQAGPIFTRISAGTQATCAIDDAQQLWCWGTIAGQTHGAPELIDDQDSWSTISVGGAHACAITTTGALYCFGDNEAGQAGAGPASIPSPEHIAGALWKSISAGESHTCGIRANGTLWCWGNNAHGQRGDANSDTGMRQVGSNDQWETISAGTRHTCGTRTNGSLWCFGDNERGFLGVASSVSPSLPDTVSIGTVWRNVWTGEQHTCAMDQLRRLSCWGFNDRHQLGIGRGGLWPAPVRTAVTAWDSICAGAEHTCGIDSTHTLWCFGNNTHGQVDGDAANPLLPFPKALSHTWQAVTCGEEHTCGIQLDGTLWCWGSNADGRTGLEEDQGMAPLTQVEDHDDWLWVSAGAAHTCGIRATNGETGDVWCFGSNTYGQLGLGEPALGTPSTLPVKLEAEHAWREVATGAHHTCGTNENGALWCWGRGHLGQLGVDDTPANVPSPSRIGFSSGWHTLGGGASYTCGLLGGELRCTGALGNRPASHTFTQTGVQANWLALGFGGSAGDTQSHLCAIREEGALRCLGHNAAGQLGNGTVLSNNSFITPSNDVWLAVAAGSRHTCAISADHALHCWGSDRYGQRGEGVYQEPQPVVMPMIYP